MSYICQMPCRHVEHVPCLHAHVCRTGSRFDERLSAKRDVGNFLFNNWREQHAVNYTTSWHGRGMQTWTLASMSSFGPETPFLLAILGPGNNTTNLSPKLPPGVPIGVAQAARQIPRLLHVCSEAHDGKECLEERFETMLLQCIDLQHGAA